MVLLLRPQLRGVLVRRRGRRPWLQQLALIEERVVREEAEGGRRGVAQVAHGAPPADMARTVQNPLASRLSGALRTECTPGVSHHACCFSVRHGR